MSLRDILRDLNIQRQQANMGQYNKTMREYQQERGIKDALRQQSRRDDIILAQEDFIPLDVRRREKRIDDNIKTSIALLVDGLNEESVPKLSVNLDRIQDIVLKENPSLSMLAQLKRFLGQLDGRIKEIWADDATEKRLTDKVKSTSSLLQNKIITDDVMKDVLKGIETTEVDEMSEDSVFNVYSLLVPEEEQRKYIRDGEDRPSVYRMKQEIKRIMGDSLGELKDPIKSTVQNVRKLREDVKMIHADYSTDELAELFNNNLKNQISTQIGRIVPADEWKSIVKDKNKMIDLLVNYYSQPMVSQVSQFPESIDQFMDLSKLTTLAEQRKLVKELFALTDNSELEGLSKTIINKMETPELIETRNRLIPYIYDTFARERSFIPKTKGYIRGKLTTAQEKTRVKREAEEAKAREELFKEMARQQQEQEADRLAQIKTREARDQLKLWRRASEAARKKPDKAQELLDAALRDYARENPPAAKAKRAAAAAKAKTKKRKGKGKPIKLSKEVLRILQRLK